MFLLVLTKNFRNFKKLGEITEVANFTTDVTRQDYSGPFIQILSIGGREYYEINFLWRSQVHLDTKPVSYRNTLSNTQADAIIQEHSVTCRHHIQQGSKLICLLFNICLV